jgi:Domain of unknown function (DUF1918)/Domain of unknown function (DUF1876)
MEAHVGDQFIVNSRIAGQPPRTGEIVECIDEGGLTPHFRVRWSDGHESIVYPGGDARVEPAGGTSSSAGTTADEGRRTVSIDLRLEEDSDHCEAVATMRTTLGAMTATGRARRNPADPVAPMIGEELAIARALSHLADQLELAAREGIDSRQPNPSHLVP